jgi:hypothetical protein
MNDVTRVIATALVADPAACAVLRRLLARLPLMGDTPGASASWRTECVRLLREEEALRAVRTALVVYGAGHAPVTVEGYGALLAWGADRVDWRVVAHVAATGQAVGEDRSWRARGHGQRVR